MYIPNENEFKKLTTQQFKDLARNNDGDIELLSTINSRLTPAQIKRLSEDDFSRNQDLDEDMRCMMDDLKAEFG